MTEKYTTQGQTQGGQQTQFDKKESVLQVEMETGRNPAQQLPNADPMSNGANNWPNQNWNPMEFGSFGYYNWSMPMMYWGNNPETKNKGKQKRGNTHQDGQTKDKIRRGKFMLEAIGR